MKTETTKPHERTRNGIRLTHALLAVAVLATFLLMMSCSEAARDDTLRLSKDSNATSELNRINALLTANRSVTRIDLDALSRLREQYPNAVEVRQLLQAALIRREDWAAAEKLIAAIPDGQRNDLDRLNLAKIYIKQGEFAEARPILERLRSGESRIESTALLGQSQLFSGALDESITTFESVRNDMISGKRADDLALLGLAYLRRGDHSEAIEVLKQTTAMAPENISANSALSRAYAAAGDAQNAGIYKAKLDEINARIAADEKKKAKLVPLYYQLEDAYAAKDFDKVIALVDQIKPEADDAIRSTLYQYLVAAYRAQGKEAEAQTALNDAAKIKQK